MKQLITITVCLFAFIGLAKADNDRPITVEQLPNKAQEFIKQNFPKSEVAYAKEEKDFWDKKYEVVFVNGEKVEFDKNGLWEEVDCKYSVVPDTIVPQQIKTQVTKQFPKATILKIERDSRGYEVKLNNRFELKYNTTFQLVDIDD